MNIDIDTDGALACPDCGWATNPDAKSPRRSLSIHATHCTGVLNESPGVLRNGAWVARGGIRVWEPTTRKAK